MSVALLVAAVASAQPLPWPVTHSGALRSTAYDLAVDGNDLWVAAGWGVIHQSIVDGGPPTHGTGLAVPGPTTRIAVRGRRAWVGSGATLYTITTNDARLQIVHALPVNGVIRDVLLVDDYLFVGTSEGLFQVDLLQPLTPVVARSLPTSSGGVGSLARRGGRLYATDGDVTVEVYNIDIVSLPQRVGEIPAFPRNETVNVVGDLILVSDGRQTRIFGQGDPPPFLGTLAAGVMSAVSIGNGLTATASGREVRIWSLANPAAAALLWSAETPVTDGTVNRIESLAFAGGYLTAAAGDAGLISWDVSPLASPFRTLAWRSPQVSGVVADGDAVIAALSAGGMSLWRRVSAGLDGRGTFDEDTISHVSDAHTGHFISFAGASLTLWRHATFPPQKLATAQLAGTIIDAVLHGQTAFVLLSNGTAFQVDFGTGTPQIAPWDPAVPSPYGLERAGDVLAVIGLDGQESVVRVTTVGAGPGEAVRFPGSAAAGFTVDGSGRVAALTFAGLHLIDASGLRLIPNLPPVSGLEIVGERVVLLRENLLEVRRWTDLGVDENVALPASFTVMSSIPGTQEVVLGGESSVGLVRLGVTTGHPSLASMPVTNRFPRDLSVDAEWVYVRESSRLVRHRVSPAGGLTPIAWFDLPPGTVDVAVAGGIPFVLDGSGVISRLDWAGRRNGEAALPPAADFVPLDLEVIGGAIYASYRFGCSVGVCEKRTDVLDPSSMQFTASMSGGVIAAADAGSSAFVLTDLPREVRRLDLRDPLRPVVAASRELASDFVSIAWDAQRSHVWILGQRLVRLDPVSLAQTGTYLDAWSPDPSGQLAFNDQRVRVSEGRLAVAGRWFSPRIWIDGDPSLEPLVWLTPAASRRIEGFADGFVVLTDSSIELTMSRGDQIRRGVRR